MRPLEEAESPRLCCGGAGGYPLETFWLTNRIDFLMLFTYVQSNLFEISVGAHSCAKVSRLKAAPTGYGLWIP